MSRNDKSITKQLRDAVKNAGTYPIPKSWTVLMMNKYGASVAQSEADQADKRTRLYVGDCEKLKGRDFKAFECTNADAIINLSENYVSSEDRKQTLLQQYSFEHFIQKAKRDTRKYKIEDVFGSHANPVYKWSRYCNALSWTFTHRKQIADDVLTYLSEFTKGVIHEVVNRQNESRDGLAALADIRLYVDQTAKSEKKKINDYLVTLALPRNSDPWCCIRKCEILFSLHDSYSEGKKFTNSEKRNFLREGLGRNPRYKLLK